MNLYFSLLACSLAIRTTHYVFLAIALVVGVVGCASPSPRFIPYTEMDYTPCESVLVLHTMPRDRTYVELGEVSIPVRVSNHETHVMELRNRAGQMGANAIVLLGDRPMSALVTRGRATLTREAIAIAIRFTDSEG
jgi:hypothetical protein